MVADRQLPGGDRHVLLMATCLCDAFFADTARAAVEVLEFLGCKVEFREAQTCCGQPAFNGGDWPSARRVVRHAVETFAGDLPVIVPSASCAAMLFHGAELAFERETDRSAVRQLGRRTWELADFIVNALGVSSWPGRYEARLAFHRSCHARGTATGAAALALLSSLAGATVTPVDEAEQCCGFGGVFAVAFPNLSTRIGALKLEHIQKAAPDILVSVDMSCMMHLGGLAAAAGRPLKTQHLAQVLRDALAGAAGR